ncbi:NAD/NADP octopine/nopaline dehydrogenase family protein [Candidatus Woesearchaeota archaeon]|nr:NAD/NADP octopine/nopaline dehydrogenase family protein [Candidatus Woesearchaeota archaeon]
MSEKTLIKTEKPENNIKPTFAVLGAGCGGQTFAGDIASKGYSVKLFNRSPGRLGNLLKSRKVNLEGAIQAEGHLEAVTTDIAEAMDGVDVIMVATTALGHKDIARSVAPYLNDGQVMMLNPSRTFGALEVANEIYSARPDVNVIICEANTLVYATRVTEPGQARVFGVKNEVAIATLIPWQTGYVLDILSPLFPQMKAAKNILVTSLGNIGAIFHPTITIFNQQKIREGRRFEFYCEGVNEVTAKFMEKLDDERQAIARSLDTMIPSLEEWLESRYSIRGDSLCSMIRDNPAYRGIYAPDTLKHRYLLEDVPTGLVPLSLVGRALGIQTPNMDYLIAEAERITGYDLRLNGRTLSSLGLTDVNIRKELFDFIYDRRRSSEVYR